MINCKNCGAEIDEKAAKCPYCGVINLEGAEEQYMEKLEDIREELDELDDTSISEVKKQIGKTTKVIIVTVAVVLVLILGVFIAWNVYEKLLYSEIETEEYQRTKMQWAEENYSKMDEMYKAGDFEGLYRFIEEAAASGSAEGSAAYSWTHSSLMDYYNFYREFTDISAEVDEKPIGTKESDSDFWLVMNALEVLNTKKYAQMSDKDEEFVEQFREEVLSTVRKRYGITDEDMYELLEQCKDEEFNNLQFDLMRKNVPSFLKKIQSR